MAGVYSAGDFRNGTTFEMEGNVFRVVEFQHVKPGKGSAFVRTKLKNVITGATLEKTFNPSDKYPGAEIEKKAMQYLYNDGGLYYFMDNETYDQMPLNESQLGDCLKYLKESGIPVSKFNLAVQKEYYKNDNDKVDFFTIECWNKLAESVVNNLDKGRKILVEGYLKLNIWSDENNKTHKNILIVAKRIEYLDFPKKMNNLESVYVDEHPTF